MYNRAFFRHWRGIEVVVNSGDYTPSISQRIKLNIIRKGREDMDVIRSFAHIMDTSMSKMGNRNPNLDNFISDHLDCRGLFKACNGLYYEGRRLFVI